MAGWLYIHAPTEWSRAVREMETIVRLVVVRVKFNMYRANLLDVEIAEPCAGWW
jgi:hypothetical protein